MFDPHESTPRVKPGARPRVKVFHHQSRNILTHDDDVDDTASVCSSVARSERFEHSQRHRSSGNLLAHNSEHQEGSVRVGRKPVQPGPQSSQRKEREFGAMCLPSVEGSERFEHSQRNKTAGDIVGHRDDAEQPQEQHRACRQRVVPPHAQKDEDEEEEERSKVRVGRSRVEPPSAIASAENVLPYATEETPVETPKRPVRHPNHYDHCNGLLTGGSMSPSKPKQKTPLWY